MHKYFSSLIIILVVIFSLPLEAQKLDDGSPFAHTYSIVARDPATGEMGVAVQSHWFSVGTSVTWGEAGVGVVATQSFVNFSFGPNGLKLMKEGMAAPDVMDKMIAEDEGRDFRQLAVLDVNGNVKSYTGSKCVEAAGNIIGENFSVQANMMLNDKVWAAMAEAFQSTEGALAERMVAALEAAQNVGGDIRGKQSAAILVVRGEATGNLWEDRLIDLRVEDHAEPVKEIKRLLKVHRAYGHMNAGDLAVEHNNMDKAMEEYSAAEAMFPDNLEMKYWHAVTLVNNGGLEEALPMFKEVFSKDENWRIMTPRLIDNGLLIVTEEQLKTIISQ